MLVIKCPFCGERDESEFHYGGEADISRPKEPSKLNDREWGDYLFMRKNTKGLFSEIWYHSSGCRRWFRVDRNTTTNDITRVFEINK
ncbi:MAG: Sarcosine oxidase subunit delta [Alphaproteobacteria bacterium MarineAlpha2_Bin1]|nr:MAG: Sarcosine oxidase subunit delta [Alphaproteobacteria bacterium MarineAlpha2_Bin1]|tara:strand:+ start:1813 stop:2073 length:261 start_codon:yes stop_codon:yes gene_type:complete